MRLRTKTARGKVSHGLLTLPVIVGLLLTACGGSATKTTPTTQATAQAAAATPTAAPSPTQAATVAATPSASPVVAVATPSTPVVTAHSVNVDALYVSTDANGQPAGGTSPVKVSVQPQAGDQVSVGFFETQAGGAGPQWTSSGWMGVVTASLILAKDPTDYQFSFSVGGQVDGPSAGALMTAAVLADYLGDEIQPTVTMTGTINPDGTIGPVGGIPQKLEGAAKAGKKTVLVPAGQRYDYDEKLKQPVDVVAAGQKLGLDVKLVPDIWQAYKALTGQDLPKGMAQSGGQVPPLPPQAFDKVRAAATNWYAKYQDAANRFNSEPEEIQQENADLMQEAQHYADIANNALQQGQVSVAYQNAVNAAAVGQLATQLSDLEVVYLSQGIDPLVSRLKAVASAETRLSGVLQQLQAQSARTSGDMVTLMDSYSNLAVAQGLIFQAQDQITTLANAEDPSEEDVLTWIFTASVEYTLADINLSMAQDVLSIGTGFGKSPAPDTGVLNSMAQTLAAGARANIAYFESLVVNPWAQQNGVSNEMAQAIFEANEDLYVEAKAAVAGSDQLGRQINDPTQAAPMTLGSSLTAYAYSADLVAKYYSLGAQVDDDGNVTGYSRSAALANMLDLADRRAGELLGAVSAEQPISSVIYYEQARILRTGDASDQLESLNNYWESSILSEMLGIFSGTLGQK
ncbi:MAG TPA: S16 family serine protease [Thermomicrobiaceae bacterium]|nr:S16 family serine protease [Thermomicrobiaceae bacterium]